MASTPNQASFLNLPSVAEVKNLVEDSLTHDWILRIEHFGPAASTSQSRQWQQWGDSLFAVPDASSVIDGIVACRASHPTHCIRLNAEKVNPRSWPIICATSDWCTRARSNASPTFLRKE